MRRITKLSIATAIIGIGSLLISYIGGPATGATIDNTPDCDTVAIFYCGAMSESQFHSKWNNDTKYKDHATVFSAFGLKKSDVSGMVNGVVWKDGRVTLGNDGKGRVVATNAITAGRWNNPKSDMTKIANTTRAYKMPTRHFVTEGQTAMIKLDANGKFKFAVIKSCGNPVTGKPVEPPKPTPNPTAECTSLETPVITNRTNVALKANAKTANGATIKSYVFTIYDSSNKQIASKTVTTSAASASTNITVNTAGSYTAKVVVKTSVGDKTKAACEKKFTIKAAPVAECVNLETPSITNRTRVALKANAKAENGAKINGYVFTIYNSGNNQVATNTVNTSSKSASTSFNITNPGVYTAKVVVKTSEGDKTKAACEKQFSIKAADNPGIKIEKTVNGKKNETVTVNKPFTYEIVVKNTGNTDLKNVKVEDKAPEGVKFQNASTGTISNNVWRHTISELKKGASAKFTITAIATKQIDDGRKNTACVDAPSISGNPDDCDDADIITEKPPTPPTPEEPKEPGIKIEKKVDGVDHKAVEKNVEFTYQIRVDNTGDVDLKDVVITDQAEEGVKFIRASRGTVSDRSWTYTIPELKKGAHMIFTITAKVPQNKAGTIKNTVCVDTPTIPGDSDDCDEATVEVPEPGKEIVCLLEGKKYPHTIEEGEFDESLHSKNPKDCEEVVPPTPEEPTPEQPTPEEPAEPTPPVAELPQTGAADIIMGALGIGALTTAIIAYVTSRRHSLIG